MINQFMIFIVIIPLISAILIPIFTTVSKRLSWWIAMFSVLSSFVLCLFFLGEVMHHGEIKYYFGGWVPPYGIEYKIDILSGYVLLVVSFVISLITIYAKKSVEKELKEKEALFYSVYLLFSAGIFGITITADIFNLYVFLEITSLSSYTLIALGKKRQALVSSFNYLIIGTISATFILIGIGYLYIATGTLNINDLSSKLPPLYHSKTILVGFAFFTVGLCIKVALFPLHSWLPPAYTFSPSVVSALLAAISTKVGLYALVRVMFSLFKIEFITEVVPVLFIFSLIGGCAIIYGSLLALFQQDVKKMLSYSTLSQIGYIILGLSLHNKLSSVGSFLHILSDALSKATLFLILGAIAYKINTTNLKDIEGIAKKMPLTSFCFLLCSLSVVGIPLTVGFVSKWYLALGIISYGNLLYLAIIILSSLFSAMYLFKVVEKMYFAKKDKYDKKDEAPALMLTPILILTSCTIIFGIFTKTPYHLAEKIVQVILGK